MENTKNKTSIRDTIDKLYTDYYLNERYDWINSIKQFMNYNTLNKVYKLLSRIPKLCTNADQKSYCINISKSSLISITIDDNEWYNVTFIHSDLYTVYKFNVPLNFVGNFDMYDDKTLKILNGMIKECVLELGKLLANKDKE